MDVDQAEARQPQHLGAKDVAVGHHDAQVRFQPAERGDEEVAHGPLGLQDRHTGFDGRELDGRRDERTAGTTLRAIRLGHHANDIVAGAEEGSKGRVGKVLRPEEDDSHHSRADDSAATSLMYDGSSWCCFFQRESSIRRFIGPRWSRKSTPSRWSISCWMARASRPVASRRYGLPSWSSASSVTAAGRVTSAKMSGMERH